MSPRNLDPSAPLPVDALATIHLHSGSHSDRSNGLCAMELVAWIAGEAHTDTPACTCPAIGAFVRSWNDNLSDEDRDRVLKPLLPRLLNTASTDAVADRRAWLAFDWLVREYAPSWLVMVKDMEGRGARLRALPEVRDLETARAAAAEAEQAAVDASAAWSAAGSAAWSAAWSAAGSAAWSAARSAAGSAAGSAAWSAAWSAAREVLLPTERALQESALQLLERMLAVTPESVKAEGWTRREVEPASLPS